MKDGMKASTATTKKAASKKVSFGRFDSQAFIDKNLEYLSKPKTSTKAKGTGDKEGL